jgi:hypothetical protein
MAGKKRRTSLAYLPAERDAYLRLAYLYHYGDDPDFARELETLYAVHAEPALTLPFHPGGWWRGAASEREDVRQHYRVTPATVGYVTAVRALAGRYGLPRLTAPDDWLWRPLTVGEWLVHAWCSWRATEAAQGRQVGPEWFPCGYAFGMALPDVPEGAFDARCELYGDARTRLGWRHQADLEATAEAAATAGYVFLPGTPEGLRDDVKRLYRHVARGETPTSIAAGDFQGTEDHSEAVARALRRMSRRIGLSRRVRISRRGDKPSVT